MEETERFRQIGSRLVEYVDRYAGTFLYHSEGYSLSFREEALSPDGSRRAGVLTVRPRVGHRVVGPIEAYSYASSLEDIGRDLEEFSFDYFWDEQDHGPVGLFSDDTPQEFL